MTDQDKKSRKSKVQKLETVGLAPPIGGYVYDGSAGGVNEPPFRVSLFKPEQVLAEDHALWAAIRNRADAISFNNYSDFIERVLCLEGDVGTATCDENPASDELTAEDVGAPSISDRKLDLATVPTIHGVDAYNLLKLATQAFLLFEAGVAINPPRDPVTGEDTASSIDIVPGEESRTGVAFDYGTLQSRLESYLAQTLVGSGGTATSIRYLKRIVLALLPPENRPQGLPYCANIMRSRFTCPSLLELIWSYWHEEGMLAQTMNAICMRFQNRRGPLERDPLANLEIDPLRPLNNLLWGYIQDEYNRLTVARRAYEYDHHYGLKIMGKAVPEIRSADSRSKFIEGFHNLLYRTAVFYRADSDTTVIADGFPLLNSLREVHILLAEGAHNQFGDLPWTSRVEMLMSQWMLSRPEMREFLRGRAMVPYQEPWMGQVDTMNRIQGWNDASITHFRNLAVFGEQILLSVRYGDWMGINDQDSAKTWARYWRSEVQAYIHAYLGVTGVDLSEDTTSARNIRARYAQPSILLRERALTKPGQAELPPRSVGDLPAGGVSFGALASANRRRLNPARKD
jgi:hypothetical protein